MKSDREKSVFNTCRGEIVTTWGVEDYLDKFLELVLEAGYTDPRTVVVKF